MINHMRITYGFLPVKDTKQTETNTNIVRIIYSLKTTQLIHKLCYSNERGRYHGIQSPEGATSSGGVCVCVRAQ